MTCSSLPQPSPVAVRDELRRVLDSSFIPDDSLLAKMLTYVVDRTLAGDGRSIKAYTVAVEALGRPTDFDPDRDSTVRVAAMRLRSALDHYYSGPGAQSALRIRMQPGSYRPTFELVADVASEPPLVVDQIDVPAMPPALLSRFRLAMPSTRVWLATISAILAFDLLATVSLMAVQLRAPQAQAAQRWASAASEVQTLGAEKPNKAIGVLVYDYIQNHVQTSYGQPIN
ncbi:MAG: hypothetical protein JNK84_05595 [Phreatobacter sp.]|uniref:hypothetical protein n=1 Tax=Phreatobacter sp. TaxID=1966341 RepID=UPI001A39B492|nr:hypothetical protein [Phreatobacter sp.]MBL8568541.1 hypothetical protein [Phreatobacter sp.]